MVLYLENFNDIQVEDQIEAYQDGRGSKKIMRKNSVKNTRINAEVQRELLTDHQQRDQGSPH